MRAIAILILALGLAAPARAADVAAGETKSEPCAACHGANGVSVSDDIPNLAGQKAKYIEVQLKAFRAETRKNPLMNAMAAQLQDADIADLAAFFSSRPGAAGSAKSELVPAIEKTRVAFPADYKKAFTRYTTIDFPKRKQVRHYYANPAALDAARAGKPMPDGAYLFVEVYKTKLEGGQPVKGADGHFVADKLAAYTAMAKQPGWGDEIPEILRNGDWNYAVFTPEGKHKAGVNQAKCFACHKPLTNTSYVFSLEALQTKARE